jgi:hypothetical protein
MCRAPRPESARLAIVHIVENVLAGDTQVQIIANSNRLNVGLLNLSMLLLIDLAMQMDPTVEPLERAGRSCVALRSASPSGSRPLITRRRRVSRTWPGGSRTACDQKKPGCGDGRAWSRLAGCTTTATCAGADPTRRSSWRGAWPLGLPLTQDRASRLGQRGRAVPTLRRQGRPAGNRPRHHPGPGDAPGVGGSVLAPGAPCSPPGTRESSPHSSCPNPPATSTSPPAPADPLRRGAAAVVARPLRARAQPGPTRGSAM